MPVPHPPPRGVEPLSEAERESMRLSDEDLDLVAGGLPAPLGLSPNAAQRLFRHPDAAPSPDDGSTA